MTSLDTTEKDNNKPKKIYSLPALYDLAFGYRPFDAEVDFLLSAHQKHSRRNTSVETALELAAGPARHSFTALTEQHHSPSDAALTKCVAVDISPEMADYAQSVKNDVLPRDLHELFHYVVNDITRPHFANHAAAAPDDDDPHHSPPLLLTADSVDTAWLLLGSMQHFTTQREILAVLRNVAYYLKPDGDGTLVIELPHPRETFCMTECTRNGWTVPLEDVTDGDESGELKVVWGDDDDEFDPIRQVRQFSVSLELVGVEEGRRQEVREVVPMRLFTVQEIEALAALSGVFEVVEFYGALEEDVDIRDEDLAYRMVCVLRTK